METVEGAVAAQRGGAHRIELCADLPVGGITPSLELMREARDRVQLPVFVMIRPRPGDFVYTPGEFDSMQHNIAASRQLGMNGIVLGILNRENCVDLERTRQLVEFADPLPVTFHRAFDECVNLQESLEQIIQTGAKRILTSGGAATAPEGLATVADLVKAAANRILIIPGSGLNPSNIVQVAKQTRAQEFHSGLSSALPYPRNSHAQFEEQVRTLSNLLANLD